MCANLSGNISLENLNKLLTCTNVPFKLKNKNGKPDYGLMQINQCNLWMFQNKDPYNPEQSIKVWYGQFVDHRCANQQGVWEIFEKFRKDGGKEIYFKLREVSGG